MFKKGNQHGVRFSKDLQPKNAGRKPSRMEEIERILRMDPDYIFLSKEDMGKLYTYLLGCTKSQIEAILRNQELPFVVGCQIRAIIADAQNGSSKTINEIMDRIWGKNLQTIEISGPAGVPLIPDTPMSRTDYEKLLKKLKCE